MIHTEQQIKEKAKKIISDLNNDSKYFKPDCIDSIVFSENKQLLKSGEEIEGVWLIYLKVLFKNIDILTLSDETGEPIFIRRFTYQVQEIKKDNAGNYHVLKNE